jgi:predicted DNA binding CopG/RHH family protein
MKKDPMKDPKLDAEEKEILESFERGEWKRIENFEEDRAMLREAARNTLRKEKRINIRLSAKDLFNIQAAAAEEGMPYQTLISSIIHKYAAGTLIDRRSLVVSEEPVPYKVSSGKKKK